MIDLHAIAAAAQTLVPSHPLYVIEAGDLPEAIRPRYTLGYTGQCLDLTLQPHLPWRGRGVAIVIDQNEIAEYASELHQARPATSRETLLADQLRVSVAHELAHTIASEWLPNPADVPTPASIEADREVLATWCAALPNPVETRPIPWLQHDGRWIRTMFHVCHRMGKTLGHFRPHITTALFGLYAQSSYEYALGDEPWELVDVPLGEIKNHPAPPAYVDLWRDDVKRWFAAIESPTLGQADAYVKGLDLLTT